MSASLITAVPWQEGVAATRILAIRLQALGDVVITLPYLRALKRSLGQTEIDFLTRVEVADIPSQIVLFQNVFPLGGGRSAAGQIGHALRLLPALRRRRYDAIVDLQNSRVSGVLRRLLRPPAWAAFDRFSPLSAGERTRRTIEAAGFPLPLVSPGLPLKDEARGLDLLRVAGWRPDLELVVLSPAGGFPTRNWPLESYARFAARWGQRRPSQFAILGLPSLRPQADFLGARLGVALLDLVGRTSPSEALAIVQRASLVLTEDCGLMHMAWTSGVPTLALFGSSPHVWSAPLGSHSRCLHSGDLPCGACMSARCRYGDVRCLTRYTPELVVAEAERLLAELPGRERVIASL